MDPKLEARLKAQLAHARAELERARALGMDEATRLWLDRVASFEFELRRSGSGATRDVTRSRGSRASLPLKPFDVFVAYSSSDREVVVERVLPEIQSVTKHYFIDFEGIAHDAPWRGQVESAIDHARVAVFCFGAGPMGRTQGEEAERAAGRAVSGQLKVLKVYLPGITRHPITGLGAALPVDLRGSEWKGKLSTALLRALER